MILAQDKIRSGTFRNIFLFHCISFLSTSVARQGQGIVRVVLVLVVSLFVVFEILFLRALIDQIGFLKIVKLIK